MVRFIFHMKYGSYFKLLLHLNGPSYAKTLMQTVMFISHLVIVICLKLRNETWVTCRPEPHPSPALPDSDQISSSGYAWHSTCAAGS